MILHFCVLNQSSQGLHSCHLSISCCSFHWRTESIHSWPGLCTIFLQSDLSENAKIIFSFYFWDLKSLHIYLATAECVRKHDQEILGFLTDKNNMCLVWKLEDSSEILSPRVLHSETHARRTSIENWWECESKNTFFCWKAFNQSSISCLSESIYLNKLTSYLKPKKVPFSTDAKS